MKWQVYWSGGFVGAAVGILRVSATASLATASLAAIERGPLFIGGYAEAVGNGVYNDLGVAKWGGSSDAVTSDVSGAAQLDVDVVLGTQVYGRGEIFATDENVVLEEALVGWQIDATWSIHLGRFETFIGWEGLDAPDLTRVNFHNAGQESEVISFLDGVTVRAVVTDDAAIGLYVAEQILDLSGRVDGVLADGRGDLGYGIEMTYLLDDNESYLDFDAALDTYSTGGGDGLDVAASINVNFQHNLVSMPLAWYGEINYTYWNNDGTAAKANASSVWAMLGTSFKMTPHLVGTLMADWINPSTEAVDDDEVELAAALLTHPTANEHFALNFEAAYIHGYKDNSVGLFLELLAIMP